MLLVTILYNSFILHYLSVISTLVALLIEWSDYFHSFFSFFSLCFSYMSCTHIQACAFAKHMIPCICISYGYLACDQVSYFRLFDKSRHSCNSASRKNSKPFSPALLTLISQWRLSHVEPHIAPSKMNTFSFSPSLTYHSNVSCFHALIIDSFSIVFFLYLHTGLYFRVINYC